MIIKATMGLRSKAPKDGSIRRIGPRMGSVIWLTRVLAVSRIGWGRPRDIGITNDKITRAKMATVNAVNIRSIIPFKTIYCWPNLTDFR